MNKINYIDDSKVSNLDPWSVVRALSKDNSKFLYEAEIASKATGKRRYATASCDELSYISKLTRSLLDVRSAKLCRSAYILV